MKAREFWVVIKPMEECADGLNRHIAFSWKRPHDAIHVREVLPGNELSRLRDENERLKETVKDLKDEGIQKFLWSDKRQSELTSLTNANAKMREALDKIPHPEYCEYWYKCTCAKQVLLEADKILKGDGG